MFLGFSNLPMALSLLDASKVSICNVNRATIKAITKAVSYVAFPASSRAAGPPRPFFPQRRLNVQRDQMSIVKANIYSWRAMPTFDMIFDI